MMEPVNLLLLVAAVKSHELTITEDVTGIKMANRLQKFASGIIPSLKPVNAALQEIQVIVYRNQTKKYS